MNTKLDHLSSLSRKLNERSDKTNAIIKTINQKLAGLNFGLEVWLDGGRLSRINQNYELDSNNYCKLHQGQIDPLPRQKQVTYLGYCNVEDTWQLAVKTGTLVEDWDREDQQTFTELTDTKYRPLLKASRQIRIAALPFLPDLLETIKIRAESTLQDLERAEKVASKFF